MRRNNPCSLAKTELAKVAGIVSTQIVFVLWSPSKQFLNNVPSSPFGLGVVVIVGEDRWAVKDVAFGTDGPCFFPVCFRQTIASTDIVEKVGGHKRREGALIVTLVKTKRGDCRVVHDDSFNTVP